MGIQYTKEDLDAYCHFWRVIGYMLGIKEEYNLCTDDSATTLPRVRAVRSQIYVDALSSPTKTFDKMSRAVVDGLWCFNPFLDYDAVMFFTSMLANVPGHSYSLFSFDTPKKLENKTYVTRVILWIMVFTHSVQLHWWPARVYRNTEMLFCEFLIRYFPYLAFYKWGSIKKSYIRI